jgi:hypothetical protein
MRLYFLIPFLAVFLPVFLSAQAAAPPPDSLRLLIKIPVQATFATADQLSNLYVVREDNAVEKYDSTGKRVARYSNNRLGKLAAADASNPLKILLWYADFQTIMTIDRTLNEIGQLNLGDAGFQNVRSIALAQDGNIWIYDDARFRLLKISATGTVIQESQPMNMIFPERITVTCIRDNGEKVFVSHPEQGISAFDQYGTLLRTYAGLKTTRFEVLGDWLVFQDQDGLRFENLSRLQTLQVPLPVSAPGPGTKVWVGNARILVQTAQWLEVYALPE